MKQSFLILTIVLFSLVGKAADCILQSEADDVLSSYKVFTFNDSSNDWFRKTSIPLCDKKDVPNILVQGLSFLRNASKSAQATSGDSIISQEGAENYLKKRITSFLIETTRSTDDCDSDGTVVAYVRPWLGPVMHVCSEAVRGYTPLMAASILLHEARHMDGFKHVFCKHGKLDSGNKYRGCDESYELQGSFGVGAGFLLDVYKSTTDPVIKQEARSNAVLDLIQRFNKMPLDLKTGALVQSEKGDITFFDGQTKQNVLNLSGKIQVASILNNVLTLFDKEGEVSSYFHSPKLMTANDLIAKDYRSQYSAEERANVLDVYYSFEYSCVLFHDSASCFTDKEKVNISFRDIKPLQFIKVPQSLLVNKVTLYLSAADGFLYAMPSTAAELRNISHENQLKKSAAVYNYLSMAPGNDKSVLMINTRGDLFSLSSVARRWRPVPAYIGEKSKKILSPYTWSKKLQEL